jgi:hypothetical protein
VDTADYRVFDHAGHFVGLAALDPQTGLVVTDAPEPSGGHDDHDSHRSPYVISSPLVADWRSTLERVTVQRVSLPLAHDQHAFGR